MTSLRDWLAQRQRNRYGRDQQKRRVAEVTAAAEERLDEQKRYTNQATQIVRDNPLAHRIRAFPAFDTGGRNVPPE